jgi:hypothetical protein
MTLTAKRMAEIDEAPSLREGGPIFTFREAGAEYRSGGRERECRTCGAVVADAEHRTICDLAGLTPFMHGPRRCARCIREQREAERWANRMIAEDAERRRPSRPPIGLRVTSG